MKKPTYSKMPLYIVARGKLFYNNREGRYLSDKEIESYKDQKPQKEVKIQPIKQDWIKNYYDN